MHTQCLQSPRTGKRLDRGLGTLGFLESGKGTAKESVVTVTTGQNKVNATCAFSADFSFLLFEQYGIGSSTKASFTPFVDPRVYQTSPTDEDEEDDESSAAGEQAWPWRFTDRHPFQYSPGTKPIKSRGYTIYGLQLPLPWS